MRETENMENKDTNSNNIYRKIVKLVTGTNSKAVEVLMQREIDVMLEEGYVLEDSRCSAETIDWNKQFIYIASMTFRHEEAAIYGI